MLQAYNHWLRLGVHKKKYEDSEYTFKKLALDTYFSRDDPKKALSEGEYYYYEDFFKDLIRKTVKYAQETDEKCRINVIPIFDKTVRKWVSKVCKSTRRHSIPKLKRRVSQIASRYSSAVRENERLNLDQNVPQLVSDEMGKKLPKFLSAEKKKELAFQQAQALRDRVAIDIGREQAGIGLMRILNSNEDIKEQDKKAKDEYSEEAKAFGEEKGDGE